VGVECCSARLAALGCTYDSLRRSSPVRLKFGVFRNGGQRCRLLCQNVALAGVGKPLGLPAPPDPGLALSVRSGRSDLRTACPFSFVCLRSLDHTVWPICNPGPLAETRAADQLTSSPTFRISMTSYG
jgi:hypothetical protein